MRHHQFTRDVEIAGESCSREPRRRATGASVCIRGNGGRWGRPAGRTSAMMSYNVATVTVAAGCWPGLRERPAPAPDRGRAYQGWPPPQSRPFPAAKAFRRLSLRHSSKTSATWVAAVHRAIGLQFGDEVWRWRPQIVHDAVSWELFVLQPQAKIASMAWSRVSRMSASSVIGRTIARAVGCARAMPRSQRADGSQRPSAWMCLRRGRGSSGLRAAWAEVSPDGRRGIRIDAGLARATSLSASSAGSGIIEVRRRQIAASWCLGSFHCSIFQMFLPSTFRGVGEPVRSPFHSSIPDP